MKDSTKQIWLLFVTTALTFNLFGQKPSSELLDPTNHALVLIDHESQMAFSVRNQPVDQLRANTAIVAGASKIFNVPTVVTTVAEKSFSGPVFPRSRGILPEIQYHLFRPDHHECLGGCRRLQSDYGQKQKENCAGWPVDQCVHCRPCTLRKGRWL
jgi:nicotinamidase-related amidase